MKTFAAAFGVDYQAFDLGGYGFTKGAGGGGAVNSPNNPASHDGGDGSQGLWIIEEYS